MHKNETCTDTCMCMWLCGMFGEGDDNHSQQPGAELELKPGFQKACPN